MADDLDIRLKVSGDTSGAKAVSGGLKQVEDQAKRTGKSLRDMERGQAGVTKGSKNSAMAVLEASRAIEDLQYGIRGILNNIPPLVMAMGGGAGLAGVVSIAAVAISQLATFFGEASSGASKMNSDLEESNDLMTETEAASRALSRALEEQAERLKGNNDEIDRRIELLKEMQKLDQSIEDLQLAQEISDIQASDLSPADKASEIAAARLRREEAKRMAEEQAAQAEITAEQARINAQRGQVSGLAAAANDAQSRVLGIRERATVEERLRKNRQEQKILESQVPTEGIGPDFPGGKQLLARLDELFSQIRKDEKALPTLPEGDVVRAQADLEKAMADLEAAMKDLQKSEADFSQKLEIEQTRQQQREIEGQLGELNARNALQAELEGINAREVSRLAPGVRSVTSGAEGPLADAVNQAAAALQDGGTPDELAALQEALAQFGQAVVTNDQTRRQQIDTLRNEINRLRSQLEATRN